MNALRVLVEKYLAVNDISRNALAGMLGYRNISKGLRVVDRYLDTLNERNDMGGRLQRILEIPAVEWSAAIENVHAAFEEEARASFRPQIQVIPSFRPTPLFVAALASGLLEVNIPKECDGLDFAEEIEFVCDSYRRHQLRVNEEIATEAGSDFSSYIKALKTLEDEGAAYSWTLGKGFRYFRHYDECLVFDRECNLVEHIIGHADMPMRDRISLSPV
jgi:hypothetical protein